jgi:hypothetical protein
MYRNVLRRAGMALRGRASPADAVGCEHAELRDDIAARFRTGMCWERYRQWEVDHIRPLSSARTLSDLIALCHFSNLQPLWRSENLIKGGGLVPRPQTRPRNNQGIATVRTIGVLSAYDAIQCHCHKTLVHHQEAANRALHRY